MQLLVLLGLAALWIAVLLPDFLRRRSTRRPIDTITSFKRHLSVLERSHSRNAGRGSVGSNVVALGGRQPQHSLSGPVSPLVSRRGAAPAPVQRSAAPAGRPAQTPGRSGGQQRRQDVIVALLAASLLSFLATLTFSGLFLYLHVAIDVALIMYVAAVLAVTRRNQARSRVTYLRGPAAQQGRVPTHMVPVASQQQRYASR